MARPQVPDLLEAQLLAVAPPLTGPRLEHEGDVVADVMALANPPGEPSQGAAEHGRAGRTWRPSALCELVAAVAGLLAEQPGQVTLLLADLRPQ